jgi:hypothetical protein
MKDIITGERQAGFLSKTAPEADVDEPTAGEPTTGVPPNGVGNIVGPLVYMMLGGGRRERERVYDGGSFAAANQTMEQHMQNRREKKRR